MPARGSNAGREGIWGGASLRSRRLCRPDHSDDRSALLASQLRRPLSCHSERRPCPRGAATPAAKESGAGPAFALAASAARTTRMTEARFWPRNFAWLDEEHSNYERARVAVLPVPYDSTASGWVGSREGPSAIIEASGNRELYDIGIGSEPYRVGIHTLPEVAALAGGPEAMVDRIEEVVGELLDGGKFVVTLGGEHTVAVGAVRAHA